MHDQAGTIPILFFEKEGQPSCFHTFMIIPPSNDFVEGFLGGFLSAVALAGGGLTDGSRQSPILSRPTSGQCLRYSKSRQAQGDQQGCRVVDERQ
jgi:hypothetical protein